METLFKLGINLAALLFILITLAEWKQKQIDRQQGVTTSMEVEWTDAQLTEPALTALDKSGLKRSAPQEQPQTEDIRQAYWNLPTEERQYLSARLQQMQVQSAKP